MEKNWDNLRRRFLTIYTSAGILPEVHTNTIILPYGIHVGASLPIFPFSLPILALWIAAKTQHATGRHFRSVLSCTRAGWFFLAPRIRPFGCVRSSFACFLYRVANILRNKVTRISRVRFTAINESGVPFLDELLKLAKSHRSIRIALLAPVFPPWVGSMWQQMACPDRG
jgi:hypothetical protein